MSLSNILLEQWLGIRRLTYDYLNQIDDTHLVLKLPFPDSQSLGYQFWCMLGAHESYLRELKAGRWQGFSSSLDGFEMMTTALIRQQMQKADTDMTELLQRLNLEEKLENGQYGYEVVMQIIKHEMHHHGQLINFMFCFHLPIPLSWQEEWALKYEG
jgi:hypothetical protein